MERMTLREAAEQTSRSITTLRRYIRSGRLRAEKRDGRFGPEYFVSHQDLRRAGLGPDSSEPPGTALGMRAENAIRRATSSLPARQFDESVPMQLYQELQMKHEQLLVQYGMIRGSGVRLMELQADCESQQRELEASRRELRALREGSGDEAAGLRRELREARLELQGRALEISALHEKVQGLEMLTRNALTHETIERQFSDVMAQSRRVERITAEASVPRGGLGALRKPDVEPSH